MTFDESTSKISMPQAEAGTYEVKVTLEDESSNSKTETISIEIKALEVEEPTEEATEEEP